MKLRIVLEVEVSDLPDSEREELEDGMNFRAVEDTEVAPDLPTVPRIEDYPAGEVQEAVREALSGLGEDFQLQAEMWAGSEFYGWLSKIEVKECTEIMGLSALEAQLAHLVEKHPGQSHIWYVAELTVAASGSVPLTEIEELVSRHLAKAKGFDA